MNARTILFVLPVMRSSFWPLALTLSQVGCSGSRTIEAEQELPVGNHVAKTVMESDLFIPEGASLVVDYSRTSRFFVSRGGALTGFPKGAREVTIFAEKGAIIPDQYQQSGIEVRTVEDAAAIYRERYEELPPAGMPTNQPSPGGVAPVVGVGAGVGFWTGRGGPWGFRRDRGNRGRGASRATSARPSSYRKKD